MCIYIYIYVLVVGYRKPHLGKSRQVQASRRRREILEFRLLARGWGKSRQVQASRRRREILKYRLLGASFTQV